MVEPLDKIYITQKFGENPQIYSQFGLKGHNGVDYRTKFDDSRLGRRELFSIISGTITQVGDQKKRGYGRYIRMRSNDFEVVYGHLWSAKVKVGDKVSEGQLLGITDNSGFSTGAHLHLGIRRIKNGKIQDYNNGYLGYIDPLGLQLNKEEMHTRLIRIKKKDVYLVTSTNKHHISNYPTLDIIWEGDKFINDNPSKGDIEKPLGFPIDWNRLRDFDGLKQTIDEQKKLIADVKKESNAKVKLAEIERDNAKSSYDDIVEERDTLKNRLDKAQEVFDASLNKSYEEKEKALKDIQEKNDKIIELQNLVKTYKYSKKTMAKKKKAKVTPLQRFIEALKAKFKNK